MMRFEWEARGVIPWSTPNIPVDDIKRFLAEKPKEFVGLAVPGMPLGVPGMEAGDVKQPFQVLAFNKQGEVEVFKEYQSY